MSFRDLRRAFRLLREYRLDFMVHRPVPDNHRFVYFASGRDNPDFQARIELYREFATAGADGVLPMRSASQLLAIEPADGGAPPGVGEPPGFGGPAGAGPAGAGGAGPGAARARGPGGEAPGLFPLVCRSLPRLNVVRTTSPLDGRSRWIEIFSRSVSKARASRWLARRYRVPESRILALGNDFNDLDLLEWAPRRYLVGDAPAELAERFPQVCAGGEADFSLAVTRWEESLPGN
jgi:hypothetical protein